MKMKKIEKKLAKLEEKKAEKPSAKIDKKIKKLEKKKQKKEKWLEIKLPFRILIKGATIWLIIGLVCYICSYIPIVKEVKTAAMGAIAYLAPEPVVKAIDVVTLNVGVSNNDFNWLKDTLINYLTGDVELETNDKDKGTGYSYSDKNGYTYKIKGKEVTKEEYDKFIEEQNGKLENMVEEVLGTTDAMSSMSISEILVKIATNSTPEIVSELLDMSNLTTESKNKVEKDVNKALKIIPRLNNNQMNELIDVIIGTEED